MRRHDARIPTVSVGLPVHNGEPFLREAVESLLSQTWEDFELIISDNASTDATEEICREYAARDPRVRYERCEENVGAAPNYNRLVALARGKYFRWNAHDDNCHEAFLERCVAALENAPDAVLAYPATHVIDDHGSVLSEYRDNLDLSHDSPHQRLGVYLKNNFVRKRGLCNPVFGLMRIDGLRRTCLIRSFVGSDRTLLAHLALIGKFVELPEVLFERRVHKKISTMAATDFASRMRWFDPNAAKVFRSLGRMSNNELSLRARHVGDIWQAVTDLVADPAERRRCHRELVKALLFNRAWLVTDVKYSLGWRPTSDEVISRLARGSRAAGARSSDKDEVVAAEVGGGRLEDRN